MVLDHHCQSLASGHLPGKKSARTIEIRGNDRGATAILVDVRHFCLGSCNTCVQRRIAIEYRVAAQRYGFLL